MKGELKLNALNTLKPIVARIKKFNIKLKWEKLLSNHYREFKKSACTHELQTSTPQENYIQNEHNIKEDRTPSKCIQIKTNHCKKEDGYKKSPCTIPETYYGSAYKNTSLSQSSLSLSNQRVNEISGKKTDQFENARYINYTTYFNYNSLGPQLSQNVSNITPNYQQQIFQIAQPQIYQQYFINTPNYMGSTSNFSNMGPSFKYFTSNYQFK